MKRSPLILGYAVVLASGFAASFWSPTAGESGPFETGDVRLNVDSDKPCQMEIQDAACLRRIKARYRIAQDVIDNRLTLLAAAELFRDLNETAIDFHWECFRRGMPGDSDDERACRQVIAAATSLLRENPAQAAAIKNCLEAQLGEYIRSGTLSLRR
jgi:hypothetical protein